MADFMSEVRINRGQLFNLDTGSRLYFIVVRVNSFSKVSINTELTTTLTKQKQSLLCKAFGWEPPQFPIMYYTLAMYSFNERRPLHSRRRPSACWCSRRARRYGCVTPASAH
eukprot:4178252-Pyramimonas_sp.AAC.1